jgi:hypothetical protein
MKISLVISRFRDYTGSMQQDQKREVIPRARLLLADDHPILLEALKRLLEPPYEVVGTVTNGRMSLE